MSNKQIVAFALTLVLCPIDIKHLNRLEVAAFSTPAYRLSPPRHDFPAEEKRISTLYVASSSSKPTTSADEGSLIPWWKEFQLRDPDLAESVLKDFPILDTMFDSDGKLLESATGNEDASKKLIYLDSAATSQKPSSVIDALTHYYARANSNVHRGAHSLSRVATEQYEAARDKVASFVNANSRNEIVFTSGASEAINLVATSLSSSSGKQPSTPGEFYFTEGDEILISEMEHHSNIVPWQMVAERTGAILKFVPACPTSGGLNIEAVRKLVSSKTKFVSIQHVSNVLGCINSVDEVVAIVRSQAAPDAKIMLDACQSVPHMRVDVQALGVDFIAASGHKMCGPTGIGFLWGRENILNSMAPYKGGGEMIDEVYMDHSTYAPAPARFEAGTPAIAQAIGLGAAIDYLNSIGMERIHKYEVELGSYLRQRLDEVDGVTVLGPPVGTERAALCAFVVDGIHPSDLGTFLDVEGVAIRAGHHCCQPLHRALGYSHSARASLYFYNTKKDVDDFIEKLEDTLKFFGSLVNENVKPDGAEDEDNFIPVF